MNYYTSLRNKSAGTKPTDAQQRSPTASGRAESHPSEPSDDQHHEYEPVTDGGQTFDVLQPVAPLGGGSIPEDDSAPVAGRVEIVERGRNTQVVTTTRRTLEDQLTTRTPDDYEDVWLWVADGTLAITDHEHPEPDPDSVSWPNSVDIIRASSVDAPADAVRSLLPRKQLLEAVRDLETGWMIVRVGEDWPVTIGDGETVVAVAPRVEPEHLTGWTDTDGDQDREIVTDGGRREWRCSECDNRVPIQYLENGVCVGCRYGSQELNTDDGHSNEPIPDGGRRTSDDTLPACPDCISDVFVERAGNRSGDYICRLCERVFDERPPISDDSGRGLSDADNKSGHGQWRGSRAAPSYSTTPPCNGYSQATDRQSTSRRRDHTEDGDRR
jgi:hypothetical protein